mmetsp:Transcript_34432/g.78492  ORF Transcript_34432/g.78492 Transcript_34432/m.78492 type:complete len:334 (+) Transcript_34432:54-1055(+)
MRPADTQPRPPSLVAPKVAWNSLHLPVPPSQVGWVSPRDRHVPAGILGRCAHVQANALQNWAQMNGHRSSLDEVVHRRKQRGEQAAAEQIKELQALMGFSGDQRSLDPAGHGPGFVTLKQRVDTLLTKAKRNGAELETHRSHLQERKELDQKASATLTKSVEPKALDLNDPGVLRRQVLFGDGLPGSARNIARKRFRPQSAPAPVNDAEMEPDSTLLPASGLRRAGIRSKTPSRLGMTPIQATSAETAQALLAALVRPSSAPTVTTRCKVIEEKVLQNKTVVDEFRQHIDDVVKSREEGAGRLAAEMLGQAFLESVGQQAMTPLSEPAQTSSG